MQRQDVASTLRRRCLNVMCPLGRVADLAKPVRVNYRKSLRWLDKVCRFSAIEYKGDNFCDFQYAFLQKQTHSGRGPALKGMASLPWKRSWEESKLSYSFIQKNKKKWIRSWNVFIDYMSNESQRQKSTFVHERQPRIQTSISIRTTWSESSLSAWKSFAS